MDLGRITPLPFDLNSEPESSHDNSENQQANSCLTADINLPVDLHSIPESCYPPFQNRLRNSSLPIDLNLEPECLPLIVDLNLVSQSCCHSENQQTNSCFHLEIDDQRYNFHAKRKRLQDDVDPEDFIIAKRVRAAREKLRQDKLNNSFQELGNIFDPGGPENSKRMIIVDAIHLLEDLTTEVSKLKLEHVALSEESRELIQEKSELRFEKASLKSDIENLELQFQRSLSFMHPLAPTNPSELVAQSISCPVALDAPSGPIPANSPGLLQSIPVFKGQSDTPSNSDSTFSRYLTPTPSIEEASTSVVSSCHNPRQKNSESKPSSNEGDEVDNLGGPAPAIELEMMPGSLSTKLSPGNKGKRPLEDEERVRDGNYSSMPSFF